MSSRVKPRMYASSIESATRAMTDTSNAVMAPYLAAVTMPM